jgi:hypothetical protein
MALVRFLLVAAMLVCSTATAWSQPKTDVVTLFNGDRITGEIVSLDRGRLEFKTDDAGTLEIEWDNVARLTADGLFEIAILTDAAFLAASDPRRRVRC